MYLCNLFKNNRKLISVTYHSMSPSFPVINGGGVPQITEALMEIRSGGSVGGNASAFGYIQQSQMITGIQSSQLIPFLLRGFFPFESLHVLQQPCIDLKLLSCATKCHLLIPLKKLFFLQFFTLKKFYFELCKTLPLIYAYSSLLRVHKSAVSFVRNAN